MKHIYIFYPKGKMKKAINIFFAVVATAMVGCANASENVLEKVNDEKIKFLLPRVEVDVEQKLKDFFFRSVSVQEDGECDGHPSTCPKTHYYLCISTIDESPDEAVYKLEPSHSWKVVHIDEIESFDEYQKYLIIHLERTLPADNLSAGWWKTEKIKVKINPWNFSILDAGSTP